MHGKRHFLRDTARVMSQENVQVVTESWAAYAHGDYKASLGAYAENTVWDDTQYRPDGAVHLGHSALVELVRTWRGAWRRYEIEAEDVLDAGGDRVAVVLCETGAILSTTLCRTKYLEAAKGATRWNHFS